MTLDDAVAYFLAARYPAAFDARTVATRVGRSGMTDGTATENEVTESLIRLARRFGRVELITAESGSQYWSATPKGVSAWTLDGSPYIGG